MPTSDSVIPGPMAAFQAYLQAGTFMIQRSVKSGNHVFPPRVFEPGDAEGDLEWVEASGLGSVYAMTTVRRPEKRGGDYNLAIIELDEGPRMMNRVEGIDPDEVQIGMRVEARIEPPGWFPDQTDPIVIFYPQSNKGEN